MNAFYDFFGPLLGLGAEPKDFTLLQISVRGVIVFLVTLLMVRLSSKRSLAEKLPSTQSYSLSWRRFFPARSMARPRFSLPSAAGLSWFSYIAFSAGSRVARMLSGR